jgi:hypothetical protein
MAWIVLVLAGLTLGLLLVIVIYGAVLALSFLVGNEVGRALIRLNNAYDQRRDDWIGP